MTTENAFLSYRNIFRIALPIMVGSLAFNIVNLVDTVMLGWVGEVELGAAAIGGIFYFVLVMVGMGLNTGMQIIVARRVGEQRPNEVGRTFRHHVVILGIYALFAFVLLQLFGTDILSFLVRSSDISAAASEYVHYRSYGVFFGLGNACFLSLYIGLGKTNIANYTTLTLALVNALLDYALIFGHWGFPQMGIGGAGLASVIAEGVALVMYGMYTLYAGFARQYALTRTVPMDSTLYKSLLVLSYPLVFQQLLSISTWFGFFIIIEHMGARSLAVSNIVKAVYMFIGIPSWALGSTANSMVSNAIGQGRAEWVVRIVKKICLANLVIKAALCLLLYIFSHRVISLFTADQSLYAGVQDILPILTVALLAFSCGFVVLMSVSGVGASHMSFRIELVSITCYTVFAWVTARVIVTPLHVVWGAEIVYWVLTLVLGLLYFRFGNWLKRV